MEERKGRRKGQLHRNNKKKQIQDNTKNTVIQIIKEKENLVRDTVDRKKMLCNLQTTRKEKSQQIRKRERGERNSKKVIGQEQDHTQSLEQEVEETHKFGKYNEGNTRPLKVRMRSQLAVEEITARANRLAQTEEYKDIWIKRDMNL